MKCDCCGTEQIQTGEIEFKIGNKTLSGIPTYNIQIMTSISGKDICEECMDKYMYIDAIFTGRDVSRGRIKYFGDGSKRDEY